jgi:hypothetical protein
MLKGLPKGKTASKLGTSGPHSWQQQTVDKVDNETYFAVDHLGISSGWLMSSRQYGAVRCSYNSEPKLNRGYLGSADAVQARVADESGHDMRRRARSMGAKRLCSLQVGTVAAERQLGPNVAF